MEKVGVLFSLSPLRVSANGNFEIRIHVCDIPEKYGALQRLYSGSLLSLFALLSKSGSIDHTFTEKPNITVLSDGHAVARSSDFIIYSVEAEFIDRVVAQFGPCTSPPPFPSQKLILGGLR